jgi:CheY-like chemotaxis protein
MSLRAVRKLPHETFLTIDVFEISSARRLLILLSSLLTNSGDTKMSVLASRLPVSKKSAPHVLVIEDDADVGELTCALVNRYAGGQSDLVTDSYAAINALYENKYDYVIVDQNLPGLKGLQVLAAMDRAIDQDPTLSDQTRFIKPLPVIFMSAEEQDISKKFRHFVIQDFVAKTSLSRGLARNLAS